MPKKKLRSDRLGRDVPKKIATQKSSGNAPTGRAGDCAGDGWRCRSCQFFNYAHRCACLRCGISFEYQRGLCAFPPGPPREPPPANSLRVSNGKGKGKSAGRTYLEAVQAKPDVATTSGSEATALVRSLSAQLEAVRAVCAIAVGEHHSLQVTAAQALEAELESARAAVRAE